MQQLTAAQQHALTQCLRYWGGADSEGDPATTEMPRGEVVADIAEHLQNAGLPATEALQLAEATVAKQFDPTVEWFNG